MEMVFLQVLLPLWIFCHRAHSTEPLVFTMVQYSYFPNSSFVEIRGNATLDGKLTHYLETQNEKLNVTQLLPLEPLYRWKTRESNLIEYVKNFEMLVNLLARERNVSYPLHVHCTQSCWISQNGSNGTFYKVVLNGNDFLRFRADNHTWLPLQDTPVASFASKKLNEFQESSTSLQVFLQEICINLVREHIKVKEAFTGKREGRPHAPLVLGISLGALAVMGLAVCIFLCTGGKR